MRVLNFVFVFFVVIVCFESVAVVEAGKKKKKGKKKKIKPTTTTPTSVDGKYTDSMDHTYPDFCKQVPVPEMSSFVLASQPFPCHKLSTALVKKVTDEKNSKEFTHERCAMDFVMCFLFACYPGDPRKDPEYIKELAKKANDQAQASG